MSDTNAPNPSGLPATQVSDNVEHSDWAGHLITALDTAEIVREALAAGKVDSAVRWLTEAVARLIESGGKDLPDGMFAEPETTGDRRWDVLLATAFLYAANLCGVEVREWMHAERLDDEYLYGGDAYEAEEYKDFVRSETPAEFLSVNVLTRPRDWRIA